MLQRPYRDEKARKRNVARKKEQKARQQERGMKRRAAREEAALPPEAPNIPVEELTDAGI